MSKCPYCGNSSGKRDTRGMCVSCGGNIEPQEVDTLEYSLPYLGVSGGYSKIINYKKELEYIEKSLGIVYA